MLLENFYKLLDEQLSEILSSNAEDRDLHKHKDDAQNKGYAFLIWFLENYAQKSLFKNYITDGNGDFSCDVIFSNPDSKGETVFYVVQSKWINYSGKKEYPSIGGEEFKATLSDFATIIGGKKVSGTNERFQKKYDEFIQHLENNGRVKFIFFSAASYNEAIKENCDAFNRSHAPNISLEVIDIERIKQDFIQFKIKGISTQNPLEYTYDAEDNEIEIAIERFGKEQENYVEKRDFLQFEGRSTAYIFLLKPQTIHQLFKEYQYSLFFKNVRNPLPQSNYNQRMVETLLTRPSAFWYFNNGITAISKLIPEVGNQAKKIKVEGLQIINGAQTVYSIYYAYENANGAQRKAMDEYARASLRLIRSDDDRFNLEITRFTNMQNPLIDSDFVANNQEQILLQNASFKTNFWYEKRRGEFRNLDIIQKNGIQIISNKDYILPYIAFYLQKPIYFLGHDKLFVSIQEDKQGLYEIIFDKIDFENIYASYLSMKLIENYIYSFIKKNEENPDDALMGQLGIKIIFSLFFLALCKNVFINHFSKKYKAKNLNISKFIIEKFEKQAKKDLEDMQKIIQFVGEFVEKEVAKSNSNTYLFLEELIDNPTKFDVFKDKLESEEMIFLA